MASRYWFKVEYGENRFCTFFVNLTDFSDYSFVKLTNDIKQNVRCLQVTTPNTIRIRFRDEDGDYVNLPYGNRDMFIEMFKTGKLLNNRYYTKIYLKVSELDSPMAMATHAVKKDKLQDGDSKIKPPRVRTKVQDVVHVDDDDYNSRVAASKPEKKMQESHTVTSPSHKINRSLDCTFLTATDDETAANSNPSPLQRYINKLEANMINQMRKVSLLQSNLNDVNEKLGQLKSIHDRGKGQVCSNCHLRLGHTARNCVLDKCTDVFSCGFEKFHHNQVNRSKLNQELKKEETALEKLKIELNNRRSAIRSLENAPTHRIEQGLLSENQDDYVVGGLKNWSLLRRHVHLIEGYCKRNYNCKIPPKESLTDILRRAEESDEDHEEEKLLHGRRTHENPSKSVLESYGIGFPVGCSSKKSSSSSRSSSTCKCVSNYEVQRCEPTTIQEEEAQLELA